LRSIVLPGRPTYQAHALASRSSVAWERKAWRAPSPTVARPMKSGFVFDGGSLQVRDIGSAVAWPPYFAVVELLTPFDAAYR
ncbi:MAG: hypothetical protein JWQ24_5577, partial [Tardiphaga sp.]|nr:hypothetical protein [Tardiphaga sp.]